MSERKTAAAGGGGGGGGGKLRKRKDAPPDEKKSSAPDVPTKEEYQIARWMRNNVPIKKTKFLNHTVEYFNANKAIDKLLDSPWATTNKQLLFPTRESIVLYLDTMLRHRLFHRARKLVVPESELKSGKKKLKGSTADKPPGKDPTSVEKPPKGDTTTEPQQDPPQESDKSEAERKKRKIRLDMHLDQRFIDSTDAYVWIYEPTPYYYYLFGLLVVVGVIAVCLFPLWPSSVRQGVYYLSLAAAGFLIFILVLAILRLLIFSLIWILSFGYCHFWFLPNLTEDVGFLASFWPIYKYDCTNATSPPPPHSEDESQLLPKNKSETESSSNEEQQKNDFELVDANEIES